MVFGWPVLQVTFLVQRGKLPLKGVVGGLKTFVDGVQVRRSRARRAYFWRMGCEIAKVDGQALVIATVVMCHTRNRACTARNASVRDYINGKGRTEKPLL